MPRSDPKIRNRLVQLKRMGNTFDIKGLKSVGMTKVHAYPLVLICDCKQVPLGVLEQNKNVLLPFQNILETFKNATPH